MKLYVCYGTWRKAGPRTHPCGVAYEALRDAGYVPEVVRSYGLGPLPGIFNFTPGRREVKRLTGNYWVPVMVGDDGTVVQGSKRIAEWAQVHPAHAGGQVGSGVT
ncbi:MAG TPA: glutathione S-transferase N-terminal domain-containing protein [Solirubrobacteraceae bacterium]